MDMEMRALIADGDAMAAVSLAEALERRGWQTVMVGNGARVPETARRLLPDALALSIVMPGLDGLAVLEGLSRLSLPKYPRVLVLTSLGEETARRAFETGADAVLPKPVSPEDAAARLVLLMQEDGRIASRVAESRLSRVQAELRALGMSPHLKGFAYLAEAVAKVSADRDLLHRTTAGLYPALAARHHTRPSCVERAIRHAIETTWTRARVDALERVFGNSIDPQRGKPTNTECIAMLAERARAFMPVEEAICERKSS